MQNLIGVNKPELRFFDSCLSRVPDHDGNLKTALGELVRLAAEGVNARSASLYLVDRHAAVLKPLITFGLPEEYVKACGEVRIGDQCCGRAVEHRKPWVVIDMATDPLFASAKNAANVSRIRAAISVPIIDYKGACYGSLACHFDQPHTATIAEIERNQVWATLIAHTIAIAQYKP